MSNKKKIDFTGFITKIYKPLKIVRTREFCLTSSTSSMRVISDLSVLLFKNAFSFLSSLIAFDIYSKTPRETGSVNKITEMAFLIFQRTMKTWKCLPSRFLVWMFQTPHCSSPTRPAQSLFFSNNITENRFQIVVLHSFKFQSSHTQIKQSCYQWSFWIEKTLKSYLPSVKRGREQTWNWWNLSPSAVSCNRKFFSVAKSWETWSA